MKKVFSFLTLVVTLLIVSSCQPAYEQVKNDPLKARIYTLDNGLKVYLTVNKEQPRMQTAIAVRAGGKNDPAETTGLSHYFEHLMFKGTEQFGTQNYAAEKPLLDEIERLFEVYRKTTDEKERTHIYHLIDSVSYEASKLNIPNEYDKLMAAIGATGTNAYTGMDQTVYIEDIPSNQVENWAMIQADRFAHNVIRGFHTELETVYEEKNMSLTDDQDKAIEALFAELFPSHPYGKQTVLGTQEDLKNPSITNIKRHYNTWYVPNNMAICISGDFEFDEMMTIIRKYFSDMKPNPNLPKLEFPEQAPVSAPIERSVMGQQAEMVWIGWRTEGAHSVKEAMMQNVIGSILSNGQAGLIDVDLKQTQKVLDAASFAYIQADYGSMILLGMPKQGQKLEEVKDLLLAEMEKLSVGDFDEALLKGIVNNTKRDLMRQMENNYSRMNFFVEAFINRVAWEDVVNQIDMLSSITKMDVINYAKEHLGSNNYVVVYKRQGVDPSEKKINKPQITPILTNRDKTSNFLLAVQNSTVQPIQPVFADFQNDFQCGEIKQQIPLFYKANAENGLFVLNYEFERGSLNDKWLDYAVDYLNYLGTADMSATEIASKFYQLACNYRINVGENEITISLSGLDENMEEAMELMEKVLKEVVPADPAVLTNYVKDVKQGRINAKKDQRTNFNALVEYAKFGPEKVAATTVTNRELNNVSAPELVAKIQRLTSYEHKVLYYGPRDMETVIAVLNEHHHVPARLIPVEEKVVFAPVQTKTNRIVLAPYKAKQVYLSSLSNLNKKFDINLYPEVMVYGSYFGGGMNAIVFQEMREARGLAYSARASMPTPADKDTPYIFNAFIATQNDKLIDALSTFEDIINNMPESEAAFQLAKEGLMAQLSTQRVTKMNCITNYLRWSKLGITDDPRRVFYEKLSTMTLDDVKALQQKWIKNKKYTHCLLGDEKDLDMKSLRKYGKIERVTTSQIFGF